MEIVYFLVILGLLFLIIEVISTVLKITGMEPGKARFQVISILTHTGFTTRESELIAQHPLRRKIASLLMLISYVGQATLISIFFSMLKEKRAAVNLLVIICALVLFLLLVSNNRYILARLDRVLEKYISRQMKVYGKYRSVDEVLKLNSGYGVYEITIEERNPLCGKSLRETRLKDRYIQILNIDRGSHIIEFPRADFKFQAADKLVVYGKTDSIKQLILEQR